MDILRFQDEDENQVFTKHLASIHLARAKTVNITKMLLKLEEDNVGLCVGRDCKIFQWISTKQFLETWMNL